MRRLQCREEPVMDVAGVVAVVSVWSARQERTRLGERRLVNRSG